MFGWIAAKHISGHVVLQLLLLVLFLAAYCVQPLLVDVIKFNGGANVSCSFGTCTVTELFRDRLRHFC